MRGRVDEFDFLGAEGGGHGKSHGQTTCGFKVYGFPFIVFGGKEPERDEVRVDGAEGHPGAQALRCPVRFSGVDVCFKFSSNIPAMNL